MIHIVSELQQAADGIMLKYCQNDVVVNMEQSENGLKFEK